MTLPRNVPADTTWMVTRRTTRRYHLLSPDQAGEVEQIYWYTTGVIAQRLGVELHMTQVLSTHFHEMVTDRRALLPRFYELRNRVLALALKALLDWPEEVFAKKPANWVELPTPAAVIKEMGYIAANCVAAGLVRTPAKWPGAKVLVDDIGQKTITVDRPERYFNADNPAWPDSVSIPITMPDVLQKAFTSDQAARDAIQAEVDRQVRKAHADNRLGYAGRRRVIKTPHTHRTTSPEERGGRNPTFAAAGNRTVAAQMIRRLRDFLSLYRRAWSAWKRGIRNVPFPYGTWRMRVHHAAPCLAPS